MCLGLQADEDPALFWQFVEAWQRDAPAAGDAPTPHQCWAGIHAAAVAHLSPNMARLFAVSLAARQYSPRLEMFRQLAQESHAGAGGGGACCWALLGGRAYTAAAELEVALAQALEARAAQLLESGGEGVEGGAGAVYPFDHVYAPPASLAPPLNLSSPAALSVELYAPLGSRCGGQLHAVLAAAAARTDAAAAAAGGALGIVPRVAYAWRPLLPAGGCAAADGLRPCTALGSEGRLVIPGYGVELALKNMEYNAQDDSKKVGGHFGCSTPPPAQGRGCRSTGQRVRAAWRDQRCELACCRPAAG
jgi:UDP-glucose:glycoprotein glucosyltransferase